MTIEEFFSDCKTASSESAAKVDGIRKYYELDSLYLVHISPQEVIWGVRGINADWDQLLLDLVAFVFEQTGANYNSDMTGMTLVQDGVLEVELLIDRLVRPYVASHGGSIKLISLSENTGEVVIFMGDACGSCSSLPASLNIGVANILKEHLPWVKNIKEGKEDAPKASSQPVESAGSQEVLVVTESAARKIKSLVDGEKLGNMAGLRLGVASGGCSGFQYEIKLDSSAGDGDEVIAKEFKDGEALSVGRVFINQKSLQYLKGTTLDYAKTADGLGETFKIINPNETGSCGCGKSASF